MLGIFFSALDSVFSLLHSFVYPYSLEVGPSISFHQEARELGAKAIANTLRMSKTLYFASFSLCVFTLFHPF